MIETVLWRREDLPGHEVCSLARRDGDWLLSGTALFAFEGEPCALSYEVLCDPSWRTRSTWVRGTAGRRAIDIRVEVNDGGRWIIDGVERPALAGCVDVDLGFSPSTNTLPIRRLSLAVGDVAQVRAAWLPFPSLEPQPLEQEYRRLASDRYRYESGGGRFVRELEVNASGVVLRYPDLWRAEAVTHA